MIREKYVNISELDSYNQRGHNLTRNLVSRERVIPKICCARHYFVIRASAKFPP